MSFIHLCQKSHIARSKNPLESLPKRLISQCHRPCGLKLLDKPGHLLAGESGHPFRIPKDHPLLLPASLSYPKRVRVRWTKGHRSSLITQNRLSIPFKNSSPCVSVLSFASSILMAMPEIMNDSILDEVECTTMSKSAIETAPGFKKEGKFSKVGSPPGKVLGGREKTRHNIRIFLILAPEKDAAVRPCLFGEETREREVLGTLIRIRGRREPGKPSRRSAARTLRLSSGRTGGERRSRDSGEGS